MKFLWFLNIVQAVWAPNTGSKAKGRCGWSSRSFPLCPEANHPLQIRFCSGTQCYSFSSPWTIVFQRSFKAEFPSNAVIAYSLCMGQTLWEMFKRLLLSVFFFPFFPEHSFSFWPSDVFVSRAEDLVSLWGSDHKKQIKTSQQRPEGNFPLSFADKTSHWHRLTSLAQRETFQRENLWAHLHGQNLTNMIIMLLSPFFRTDQIRAMSQIKTGI